VTTLDYALEVHAAGYCVIPPTEDGVKKPIGEWKHYQTRRPDEAKLRAWYLNGRAGIGVLCGTVSGGLELFEFEGQAIAEGIGQAFVDAAEALGYGDLVDRIATGYSERSPTGGIHWLYHCTDTACAKLARRPATAADLLENPDDKLKTLIETKGEGGYCIVAPSGGPVHPSGDPWELLSGGFGTIVTITPAERDVLHRIARSFDREPPKKDKLKGEPRAPVNGLVGPRPGDVYNSDPDAPYRTLELLERHGWQEVHRYGDDVYLRRPGKPKGGHSAVLHLETGVFVNWSTSTVFEGDGAAYPPFGVLATLKHDGDFSAAASALARNTKPERHLETVPGPSEPPGWLDEDEALAAEWNPPDNDDPPPPDPDGRDPDETFGIEFLTVAQLARDVDQAPPVGWLIRPLWPADAYGVLAAEKKAGKTWANLDLVVSVASATPWMGAFPIERPGRVVVFLGEGGKRKMLRRLRAICAAKDIALEDLDISLCFRAPHLTDHGHLTRIGEEVGRAPCALVVVDPLYLAARGAKSSQLYEMGEHLERIQTVVQAHDAALAIIHHWNKTGEGKGADRMSGVGPAEWGRVLGSAAVLTKHTDLVTRETSVVLDWEFTGDEIPETEIRIRRRIWADNPDDLDSPLHYHVELLEGDAAGPDAIHPNLGKSQRRVLAVLEATEDWLTTLEIGDALVGDSTGIPLKKRTIQQALKQLADAGLAKPYGDNAGTAYSWSAMHQNLTERDDEKF
jgi:hypothetical protein